MVTPADAWHAATDARPYDDRELRLDRSVHNGALSAAAIGTALLIAVALRAGSIAVLLACLVYAAGLLGMLLCSALYTRTHQSRSRDLLRRFDHAAIFVMIAGTYTPFTVGFLPLAWSVPSTAAIWALAIVCAGLKLMRPTLMERMSVLPYLALGWAGLVVLPPLVARLDHGTMLLLLAGALLYSVGTIAHLWSRLHFHAVIWHGFVISAACCHYLAILDGVLTIARAK